ncbi:bifunctional DNA-formamidopyrimidine glycosylase/DNA-(apurinic or apyrimidinic site) lyase [Reinekea thalattae]|uniref:Formamidopyrimidine-DNA glycosylase n=1 Tax=Reinekea thalattae TaxID=2593301 RepID=A0A5C8Z965_9GAMM|nr:bifunctional DNA-formamidopyrimidine glycosylase/DNA-(apurinic or apyrimidinic site) lyase [Reinekea thalattae]TXR54695.1 bifunctional DNA-formamidopyrimidine glycosylase/DNA-(apurinic or apyrimidinic site) lyase [Reinekea thalattae]
MPELPEVETTKRGIAPHIEGQQISRVSIRDFRLRWPIEESLAAWAQDQTIHSVERRSKYLILNLDSGALLIHLGMSGNLRVLFDDPTPNKHDHFDIELSNGTRLRYHDPRRFGAFMHTVEPVEQHALITHLGPEPLTDAFTSDYLYQCSRKRKTKIKTLIMDAKMVVGVGNIYANEALFLAGIYPHKQAGRLTKAEAVALAESIKQVLAKAIEQGGTTLKDFVGGDGKPGYFAQSLNVYGRAGLPCLVCGTLIKEMRTANRSTCYCTQCQPS